MKKSVSILAVAFLLILFGCKKSEITEPGINGADGYMKAVAAGVFPAFIADWSNYLDVGDVDIYNDADNLYISILLDNSTHPDIEIYESHVYVGTDEPAKSAPGKFPFYQVWPDGYSYVIDLHQFFEGGEIIWTTTLYVAVHAVVADLDDSGEILIDESTGEPVWEETAWLLEVADGTRWYKPNGNSTGWGEYFAYDIESPLP